MVEQELTMIENVLIDGPLTFVTVSELAPSVLAKIRTCKQVSLDLNRVSQIDSSGLAFLLECFRLAHNQHKKIEFCNISAKIKEMLQIADATFILQAKK